MNFNLWKQEKLIYCRCLQATEGLAASINSIHNEFQFMEARETNLLPPPDKSGRIKRELEVTDFSQINFEEKIIASRNFH